MLARLVIDCGRGRCRAARGDGLQLRERAVQYGPLFGRDAVRILLAGIGTQVVVEAFTGDPADVRASAAEIAFPNGAVMSLGNPQTEAAEAAAKQGKAN